MQLKDKQLEEFFEKWAPNALQESYDNSGWIVKTKNIYTKALICLDATEQVVEEAIKTGCDVILAHHPIVFKGLKSLTGKHYVERTVMLAIKNNISIMAIHTNLDNVLDGVNSEIAKRLQLKNCQILSANRHALYKLVTFVPVKHIPAVRNAIFDTGGGQIGNYSNCSFSAAGTGTFLAGDDTQAYVGKKGELHKEKEEKLEIIVPEVKLTACIAAMQEAHPYEEVAFDVLQLHNTNPQTGSGLFGELERPFETDVFLEKIKNTFNCGCIKYTKAKIDNIKLVAVCGGSGFFLLQDAIRQKADIFITSDVKYHDFFEADSRIVLADIGHYESEQFTTEIIHQQLSKIFPNFAARISGVNTNPVNYL